MDEITTTTTGHRITVEQVGTWFELLINGTVVDTFSGHGARESAERKAARRAADIEADALWMRTFGGSAIDRAFS